MKNDTISRAAAIDGVKTLHEVAWKNWHEPSLSAHIVIDMINSLPTVQPDLDITAKIDKAYDDGYQAGYLQGRHDWGDLDG